MDPQFAITPYIKRVAEHQINCAKVIHSIIPKTWEMGEAWFGLALQYSGGKVTYVLPPNRLRLSSSLSNTLGRFREFVENALNGNLSLIPLPTEDFPREFTFSFEISPTGAVVPSECSINLALSQIVSYINSEICRNERKWEQTLPELGKDQFGIYLLTVDSFERTALCEVTKSIGVKSIDEKIMQLIEKYCFSINPKQDRWPPESNLPMKYQVSISFANYRMAAITIAMGHLLSMSKELYAQLPKPLPRPPHDLSSLDAELAVLRNHCSQSPDDIGTRIKYGTFLVYYAGKAKNNQTATIEWQEAACLSVQTCRDIVADFPESADAHRNLAYCLGLYAELLQCIPTHVDEIRSEYRKAEELGIEESWYGNRHLANLYASIGKFEEALREIGSNPGKADDDALLEASYLLELHHYSSALSKVQFYIDQRERSNDFIGQEVVQLRQKILSALNQDH
jgi:hypothetical protein